ncbi:MAG: hypothetical protein ACRD5I_08350 [Candidatus Acidiferrales bacterium]
MKGTLKLKLATLAVILAAAVLVPTAQAAEVSASLTSDNDGTDTPFVGPVTGQAGDTMIFAFYVRVDVAGSVGGGPTSNSRIKVCNNITLNADGTFTCDGYHTFYLLRGQNYNSNKDHYNSDRTAVVGAFPDYVDVRVNIAEGTDCPTSHDLLENLFTYSGTGTDFGGGLLSLNLPFQVSVECTDWQGCSHGYWKNHTQSWESYEFTDLVGDVFSNAPASLSTMTLLEAMQFKGPGDSLDDAKAILLQQAVASLLNADHSDVNFPMDSASLISAVNDALASGDRDAILALKDELDTKNNLGCPLN